MASVSKQAATTRDRWGDRLVKARDQLYIRFYFFFDPCKVFESEISRKFKEWFFREGEKKKKKRTAKVEIFVKVYFPSYKEI